MSVAATIPADSGVPVRRFAGSQPVRRLWGFLLARVADRSAARMASRPSSVRGRGERARPEPSSKSAMPMIVAGAVALLVVVVLVLQNGGSQPASAGQAGATTGTTSPPPAVPKPVAEAVTMRAAKAGKAPGTPAPALTAATLQELNDLLAKIKALRNESVTARTGSADNQTARAKMGEAKKLCERWISKVQVPLQWQEQAQMEDWAQPAEYTTLEQLYATYQRLDNEVRKGGG